MSISQAPTTSHAVPRIYRLIHDVYLFLSASDRHVFQSFGLTTTQYSMLMLIDETEGMQLVTLAERILVARSTVTRMVDQLEDAGIVRRIDDPADRRAQRVLLTQQGLQLRKRVYEAHVQVLDERLHALDDGEDDELIRLLSKVRDGLERDYY